MHAIFQANFLEPKRICNEISALYGVNIVDEIQACPEAIESLRFFYEKRRALHVVAAGSLLEFALQVISSFGVGRIESVFMRPLTLGEFMRALGHENLHQVILGATPKAPLSEVLHNQALNIMRDYMLLGGLPEVISKYLTTQSLLEASETIEVLRQGYEDDFAKYAGKVSTVRLKDTLKAVAQQAGNKFVYSHAYVDANSAQVHQALSLLEMAGLVIRVLHSSANGIPLGAGIKPSKFKALIHDVGLFQRLVGLSPRDFFGEVDYVIQNGCRIIPIEVKARTRGSMKSLGSFIAEKKSQLGIRISAENFSYYGNILVVPMYAIEALPSILEGY